MSQIHVVEQIQSQWHPKCAICEGPVAIEESKTNEYGQAVHERCYVSRLMARRAAPQCFDRQRTDILEREEYSSPLCHRSNRPKTSQS
jgi:hypothetical protein